MQRNVGRRKRLPHVIAAARRLLSCGVVLGLGLGTYWAVRLAWADHLSRSQDLTAREQGVRLFPAATLYGRLAEKREEWGGDPVPDLERAAALEPENAEWRVRLGLRAELWGDLALAETSYLAAARLSRLYQPRYLLAQYYFRRQNADGFHAWSRAAFLTAYGDVTPLLDLCRRLEPDGEWLAGQAPGERPEIAAQILLFLAGHQPSGAARGLALRLTAEAKPEHLPALLEYINRCVAAGDGGSATRVWNALCMRALLPDRPLDAREGESLTNGNFQHAPSGMGFDWRMERAPWVGFAYSAAGLRVTLSGDQPESCLLASEFVPVAPGRRYRLRLSRLPAGTPSVDGLAWVVYDVSGKALATAPGADGWLTFESPDGSRPIEILRLGLRYERPLGATRLAGSFTIAGVQLEPAP